MSGDPSAPAVPTAWTWPDPPRSNRFAALVTEIHDLAADGRRVAVIEGGVWPEVGTVVTVQEDPEHVRVGPVVSVELVLMDQHPATVRVSARLERRTRS